ncbi:hypothetical protein HZH68_011963 [Vespula germanica]|uniref:Transmembrane protein 138 n=1 Tax=Vespula germanica TaxID=30212 RepID=A0A834JRB1_VESGE|nr:hypothetical protein HZH68_011963 [Vespula germanica]
MNIVRTKKYMALIMAQYFIFFFDIFVNSFGNFTRKYVVNLLFLYTIQDFCLVIAITVLLINILSTYIFQAGLFHLLYIRFGMTLIVSTLYLLLSFTLHTWHIMLYWSNPLRNDWTKGFHATFVIHRIVAVFYYYFYKTAVIKVADQKLYEEADWTEKHLTLI